MLKMNRITKKIRWIGMITIVLILCTACQKLDDAFTNNQEVDWKQIIQANLENENEQLLKELAEGDGATEIQATAVVNQETKQDAKIENTGIDSVAKQEEIELKEENPKCLIPGFESFEQFKARHTGSADLIGSKTIFVSIFLDEPSFKWKDEDIKKAQSILRIGYQAVEEKVQTYGVQTNLVYDTDRYTDLFYRMESDMDISSFVTVEEEKILDDKIDQWIESIPVENLLGKYDCSSVVFLFFISHEGCSYSSMHFVEDGSKTWDESCLLYLRDLYSSTYDYETPSVYGHELLHLFGAEDLYVDAEVFSMDAYRYMNQYHKDIMGKNFDMINGKYVTYPATVPYDITDITAYFIGILDDEHMEKIEQECPELKREEKACFPGCAYDRPF